MLAPPFDGYLQLGTPIPECDMLVQWINTTTVGNPYSTAVPSIDTVGSEYIWPDISAFLVGSDTLGISAASTRPAGNQFPGLHTSQPVDLNEPTIQNSTWAPSGTSAPGECLVLDKRSSHRQTLKAPLRPNTKTLSCMRALTKKEKGINVHYVYVTSRIIELPLNIPGTDNRKRHCIGICACGDPAHPAQRE